eukprot:TRINITY_DN4953_c0_g1_i1.p1 TRINITY_DN4953_c0_g1~~TRINITY_DN4953_c0_g1_i1.p1  ORF type:complete len:313 (+),score=58.67 TRINITY_DN4953_c0_g1_i1:31-969(+)
MDGHLFARYLLAYTEAYNGLGNLTSLAGAREWYESSDAFASALVICLAISTFCWLAAPALNDYSVVDRLWSLTPVLFAWHFAYKAEFGQRNFILAVLVTIWGARLTYNFARKGGYVIGHEDYRWPFVRKLLHPIAFQVFNFVFIAFYQNWLLMMIVAPAYIAMYNSDKINNLDIVASISFVVFFCIEVIADEQQWDFQTRKYQMRDSGMPLHGDYKRGFLTKKLFALSRHPNFFSEQMIWWSVYLFSVAACGQVLNWSILGPLLLTLLFQGSTPLTEYLSIQKYPAYRIYQQTTSRLIPWFPGQSMDELNVE